MESVAKHVTWLDMQGPYNKDSTCAAAKQAQTATGIFPAAVAK